MGWAFTQVSPVRQSSNEGLAFDAARVQKGNGVTSSWSGPSSRFLDQARAAIRREPRQRAWDGGPRPIQVLTVTNNKGGIGKTTIATNLAVVRDQESLAQAQRVFDLLCEWKRPLERARALVSLVDLRIKYRSGETRDVLGHLVFEIRRLGYPLFETFISRSPKIEALYTNPRGRALSILHGDRDSLTHCQIHDLAEDVLAALEKPQLARAQRRPRRSGAARQRREGLEPPGPFCETPRV